MVNFENASIINDSYIMIVWGEDLDKVKILKYDDKKAQNDENSLTLATLDKKFLSGKVGGALKQVARFGISKALPPAVSGRVITSLTDILNDGKIKLDELQDEFIQQATNELDKVSAELGFGSVESFYDAIKNNGVGVNGEEFIQAYTNATKEVSNDFLSQENNQKSTANVLKLKFCESDTETLNSEIPERRTEKGFAYSDYIYNALKDRSFTVILGGVNNNPFEYKKVLEQIRDSRIPFDVYINDKENQVQEVIENCLFSDLSFDRSLDLGNSISCSISIKESKQGEVETAQIGNVSGGDTSSGKKRKQKPSYKKMSNKIKNTTKKNVAKKTERSVSGKLVDAQLENLKNSSGENDPVYKALVKLKR